MVVYPQNMMLFLKAAYSLFFYLYSILALILSVLYLVTTSYLTKNRQEYLFRGSRVWAKSLILPFIARVKVSGRDNIPKKTPVVFISNHQSYFDIPVLLSALPGSFRFMVKKEFFRFPIFGFYTRISGHLPVDREAGAEAHKSLLKAVEMIKGGRSVIIFPEGTRSPDGQLQKFKRGGLTIAFETGAPVIPIAISGTYKIMRRNNPLLWPGRVTVKIGEPIHLKAGKPDKEIYLSTIEFIKERIGKMLEDGSAENA